MPSSGYFDTPFASAGSLAAVPDAATADGSVNYSQGYGTNYTLAPGATGALNVENTKLNQILNDITSALQNLQQQAYPPYITPTMNGGTAFSYPLGARVSSGGRYYRSLIAGNTNAPGNPAQWEDETAYPGVQFKGVNGYAATHTFGAADFGAMNVCTGTWTGTLPAANSVRSGACLPIFNNGTGIVTINAAGSDTLQVNGGSGTSMAVKPGQTVFLSSTGVSAWYAGTPIDIVLGRNNLNDVANIASARANLGAAQSGTNADITTLSALVALGSSYVYSQGQMDFTHSTGSNMGVRIRRDPTNTSGRLQFTDNPVTTELGGIGVDSSGALNLTSAGNIGLNGNTGNFSAYTPPANTRNTAIANTQWVNPASLLSAPGYVKLASGLIIQWGVITSTAGSGTVSFSFPIAFPNAVFATYATETTNGTPASFTSVWSTPGLTGTQLYFQNGAASVSSTWLAIGY